MVIHIVMDSFAAEWSWLGTCGNGSEHPVSFYKYGRPLSSF
jgi:hypothetical protein